MTSPFRHLWVTGPDAPSARSLCAVHALPPALAETSAHRRLRGPYSAAGQVVRTVTPWVVRHSPAVASHHDIELVAVAPQLAATLPRRRATLTTLTAPTNRTRFYPGVRTTRLAHGLVEFLGKCARLHDSPRSLVLTDVDDADMTDLEWVGILLRRTDPQTLRVVVHTRGADVPEPLGAALRAFTDRHDLPADRSEELATQEAAALAATYVAGDGTSRDPALLAAYEATDPATRAALHDARADELELVDPSGLALGAIPYHRERGSDPTGAGAEALLGAIEHCMLEGFYDAVIELAPRCLAVLDWRTRVTDCWLVVAKVTTALAALERPDEAEAYYDQACAATTDPSVHLQSAYGRAMLLTRFYTGARRNHSRAKSWVNTAICISALLPDDQRRAFNLAFNENGLALVEMHLGNLEEALRLVEAGIARLDAQVHPDQHTQHRSVLAYNRAQLLAAMGSLDTALSAYGAVIAEDPHHSEYYFERASLLRRMGRLDEASKDYDSAIAMSPPYPEPHYNRGDLAAQRGDLQTAISEFSYVLELDPTFVDALANRGALRLQTGDVAGADADVSAGLRLRPDSAQLQCLRGLVALESGDRATALVALDQALALDPVLAEALANRAVLRFEEGDTVGAIEDLSAALELTDDPAIRENRALAYREAGRMREAIADCERAVAHPDADHQSIRSLRALCESDLAQPA